LIQTISIKNIHTSDEIYQEMLKAEYVVYL